MGKWTSNYTDDVLHAKISALVTGAIRRSTLEHEKPLTQVSKLYNQFVTELDTGDSFTTTMVDILVNEVMERRGRSAPNRRFISERTAKSLRQLTGALNIYRHNRPTRRHPIDGAYALGSNALLLESDEDEFDTMLDEAETAHMSSSEIFQAMSNLPPSGRQAASASPSETPDHEDGAAPPTTTITGRSSPWTVLPATSTATNFLRSSLPPGRRRVVHARSSDFSEFSRRHRSAIRASVQAARASEAEPAEVVTEPREGQWTYRAGSSLRRRFFALDHLRQLNSMRRQTSGFSEGTDLSGDDDTLASVAIDGPTAGSSTSYANGSQSATTAGWFGTEPSELYVSPRSIMSRGAPDGVGPQLHRGGIPAPETLFSQPPLLVPVDAGPSSGPVDPILGEPAAYPTPGSVENDRST